MVGNLRKRKVNCSKRPSEKKKNGLEKKKKKEVEMQLELCCVKSVELMIFEKKNYTPLVFRNYFVPYISFLHS